MGKINVLDQNTINQIAAGEVIDRPASVVKELVENAIDAGATAITIELKEGGLSLIRITDNGSGIDEEDVHKAFMPHATSKIKDAADLVSISSLGFRGEALSSIAAVCQVELISKTREALSGYSFKIEGGEELGLEEIGAPDGTTFLVKNIFFNTPARRKFLKSPQTEGTYILELAEHMALSVPDISFKVIINGQTRLSTSGNGKLKDVIYAVYGKEIAGNLIPVNLKKGALTLSGFIGKPVINRSNKAMENFFVNGRYVKAKLLERALEDAYKNYMMVHKHPFCVLFVNIPSDLLDVNVHPAKMELRFSQEEILYNEIYSYLNNLLINRELIQEGIKTDNPSDKKSFDIPRLEPFEMNRARLENKLQQDIPALSKKLSDNSSQTATDSQAKERPLFSDIQNVSENSGEIKKTVDNEKTTTTEKTELADITKNETYAPALEKIAEAPENYGQNKPALKTMIPIMEPKNIEQQTLFDDNFLSKSARVKHRYLGQIFRTYLLIEYDDKLYIIDQHAAHEKVLYEQNMKRLRDKTTGSQVLATPIMLHLSERQKITLENSMDTFKLLGFDLEEFGQNTYCCRAIPDNMFGLKQTDMLYEMLDDMSSEYRGKTPDTMVAKIASMSCKAAVKAGKVLSDTEADALVEELLTLENPYFCPHGRPSIISMSRTELEKKFKRIV